MEAVAPMLTTWGLPTILIPLLRWYTSSFNMGAVPFRCSVLLRYLGNRVVRLVVRPVRIEDSRNEIAVIHNIHLWRQFNVAWNRVRECHLASVLESVEYRSGADKVGIIVPLHFYIVQVDFILE